MREPAADPTPGAEFGHQDWEALLSARDQRRLEELRMTGADLRWSRKELKSDDGRVIVHHFIEILHPQNLRRLGASGPVDFRFGHREKMVPMMVRSALGQALSKLRAS